MQSERNLYQSTLHNIPEDGNFHSSSECSYMPHRYKCKHTKHASPSEHFTSKRNFQISFHDNYNK